MGNDELFFESIVIKQPPVGDPLSVNIYKTVSGCYVVNLNTYRTGPVKRKHQGKRIPCEGRLAKESNA